MSQTAALYHLQTLDSQIDAVRKRLDEINELLSQNEAVRAAQTALTDAENSLNEWRTRQASLERERDQLQQEAKTDEDRLYSGHVHNPREMTDLQDKIAELNHRRESLEEPILAAMLAVDEGATAIKSRQADLDHVIDDQKHAFGQLGQEQTELTERLTALVGEAGQVRDEIEASHLALYDKLRKKSGGVAVTQLRGNGCGVCGVDLTTQQAQRVRHDEILPCPTCGRILSA